MDITKLFIFIGIFIGSSLGSYIPLLWGGSLFSMSSLLFGGLGAFVGLFVGYKIAKMIG